jgi:pimeloyl-ACP methyl ester carboxylesterase
MGGPEFFDAPVRGGALRVARWGSGPSTILGIHGITASSLALAPVARQLGPDTTLLAPDLRGRGGSADLPGPYGMRVHAADCARLLETAAGAPVVVIGESMGAFVAVVLAADRPDLVERLVLVDGGLPLPLPHGVTPEAAIRATLGPALARLRLRFATAQDYLDFWRVHPAFIGAWNEDVAAYLRYDLIGAPPRLVSRVAEAAVEADAPETLASSDVVAGALDRLPVPAHLVRAARNLQNLHPPLIPAELVEKWRARVPRLTDELVKDTNHYSLMLTEPGTVTIAARAMGFGLHSG